MIGYEKEAWEAALSGRFTSFESWHHYFYTCRDCGEDTSSQLIHRCQKGSPYRSKPSTEYGER